MMQPFTFQTQGQPYDWGVPPDWVLDSASLAAGAISSTLADMLTFLEAQMSPSSSTTLGQAIIQTQTQQLSDIPMGLAWQIGNDYLSKDGLVDGYTSFMIVDPSSRIGVVAIANNGNCSSALAKAAALVLATSGDPLSSLPPFPSRPLRPPVRRDAAGRSPHRRVLGPWFG